MFAEHFSLENIPFGIATSADFPQPTVVTRLHDDVIFISILLDGRVLADVAPEAEKALRQSTLNDFASLSKSAQRAVRSSLQTLLGDSADNQVLCRATRSITDVQLHLPVYIPEYTDFSCSQEHNLNAGEAVLNVRKLPPGFLHFPIGYGGRASSIVVSGTPIHRPSGHYRQDDQVVHGVCGALDYELEVACVVGKPLRYGNSVAAKDAEEHIFGVVLLNDWSARDIQGFEMMPLGPFMGKNFGTTISPWVVTLDALEPFRTKIPDREIPVAAHLDAPDTGFDLQFQSRLIPANSNASSEIAPICSANFASLYWSFPHLLAHQTTGGSGLRTGDVLASGTISGSDKNSQGCLLETTRGGKETFEVTLPDGSKTTRGYLEDGDTVLITGQALKKDGSLAGVGFGECIGTIAPSAAS